MPAQKLTLRAPEGLLYRPDFLSPAAEAELLEAVAGLKFEAVVMRGVAARRRVAHFGSRYRFDSYALEPAPAMPPLLQRLRDAVAALAGEAPEALSQALVAWYPPGAGIGWHRDAPRFGPTVIGISLGSECRMRMRRPHPEAPETWEIYIQPLPPRSLYVLGGAARTRWQHSIPPGRAERFSVTFRSLRQARAGASPSVAP